MEVHLTAKGLDEVRLANELLVMRHLANRAHGIVDGTYRSRRRDEPMHVDGDANGRATLAVDLDVGEGGGAGDVHARGNEKTARYSDGLDGLVHGTGTHALDVDRHPVLDHSSNGTGDRGRR